MFLYLTKVNQIRQVKIFRWTAHIRIRYITYMIYFIHHLFMYIHVPYILDNLNIMVLYTVHFLVKYMARI